MFKKRSSPITQKVSNLLAEIRKPIIARVKISLINSGKLKRVKLLKHYNYGYIQEYEYSPSSTPLVRQYLYKRELKKQQCGCRGLLVPMFLVSRCCLGDLRGEVEDENHQVFIRDFGSGLEALPSNGVAERYSLDGESSIDERAEEFIERFYEEMRLQRQQSLMK
ncbi:unnamed protein product [Cuscuta europaea]|uniref:Cotton fiber protein n=1 Tax=Cuscuta europaea TaxID=41803 RepID=A0A9P0ZUJ5_CUSEU|nr:unnamed protein product [Cuscuta europaea]